MSDTIISNEIEESRGLNPENVEDVLEEKVDTSDASDMNIQGNNLITEEYFNKVCEEIKTMNFIEIQKFIREIKSQKNSVEQAKETVTSVLEMKENMKNAMSLVDTDTKKDLAAEIEAADAEIESGVSDMKEFLDNYDDTISKMEKIIEAAEAKEHEFDEIEKTTSYLTQSMLEVLNKNAEKIDADNPNLKNLRIYYKETKNIFENRTSIDWILSKIPDTKIQLRRLKTELKKDKTGNYLKNIQKNVTGAFCSMFNINQMSSFEEYLKNAYSDEDTTFYVQYVLYLIYTKEKTVGKYGKHKWVEVLIMNVMDVLTEMYDLEGGKVVIDENLQKIGDAVKTIM